jgi:hypothetical protein
LPNVPEGLPTAGRAIVAAVELVLALWLDTYEHGPYPLGCEWLGRVAARFNDGEPVSKTRASIWLRRLRDWGSLVHEDSDVPPNEKLAEGVRLYRLGVAPEELTVPRKALGVEAAVVEPDPEAG